MFERKRHAPALSIAMSLALAPALAGCSNEKQLDIEGAKAEIERELDSRFRVQVDVLECPDDVALEAGTSFDCQGVDGRGRDFSIMVELLDDAGKFTFAKPKFDRAG